MDIGSLQFKRETLEGLVKSAKERGITAKALVEKTINSLYGQTGKAVILDFSGLGKNERVELAIKRREKPKAEKRNWPRRIWRAFFKNPESARRMRADSSVLKGARR